MSALATKAASTFVFGKSSTASHQLNAESKQDRHQQTAAAQTLLGPVTGAETAKQDAEIEDPEARTRRMARIRRRRQRRLMEALTSSEYWACFFCEYELLFRKPLRPQPNNHDRYMYKYIEMFSDM
eukprot:jgi/Hompol1/2019/HPOL_002803-RA